jgi:hypothetical protein
MWMLWSRVGFFEALGPPMISVDVPSQTPSIDGVCVKTGFAADAITPVMVIATMNLRTCTS